MSKSQYVLSMNSHGQITIPVSIRKKWHLNSNTLIVGKINPIGQMIVFPAEAIPKGLSLEGHPKLQNNLKRIYEKLEAEVEKE
jgi:bifunctional DNA-binding transcriptional regulator/antitoxin component of YhaV-PrlF toxin-antitoxin module